MQVESGCDFDLDAGRIFHQKISLFNGVLVFLNVLEAHECVQCVGGCQKEDKLMNRTKLLTQVIVVSKLSCKGFSLDWTASP